MPLVIAAVVVFIALPAYLIYTEINEFLEDENMTFREFAEMMLADARS